MTALCLDNRRQSFWQLINRSVQCVLGLLSPWVDQNLLQLISVWNSVTIHHLLQRPAHWKSMGLDPDCSATRFLVHWTQAHWNAAKRQCGVNGVQVLHPAGIRSRCSRYCELPAVNLVRVRSHRNKHVILAPGCTNTRSVLPSFETATEATSDRLLA